ncbi:LppM family (lipo)protein [Halobacillus seohaensis]|uniref:LppM family (Lipo)protein n=1 Tax=Halobacillus seohaensis TaxID=447421 RepID=A0ABW2ETM6_9BACI
MNKNLLFLCASLIFILTGCVKGDFGVKINKDGSGVNTITLGVEEDNYEQFGGSGEDTLSSSNDELETQGYMVEKFNEDGYTGFKATKEFDDVSQMTVIPETDGASEENSESEGNEESNPMDMNVSEGFFTTTYTLEGEIDLENSESLGGMEGMIADQMDFTFTLDLPVKAKEHNADEVDGKVLTWEINPTGSTDVVVEADAPNLSNIIVVGIGVIVVLGLVVIAVIRRGSHKD